VQYVRILDSSCVQIILPNALERSIAVNSIKSFSECHHFDHDHFQSLSTHPKRQTFKKFDILAQYDITSYVQSEPDMGPNATADKPHVGHELANLHANLRFSV